ncbi:SRPBCC family protein [Roseitranquillus sediminis]|uniref:SRPBCC family protein n=1 Tax=Roseitranquillus sediminis TaxID=2809051 RepID=UPI001D0C8EB8|nr:carbon monoxide dehydrogenase subunit G [Roseitranquillus sediminis]MBM9593185.1 carbon monoxide dehydrogenase subunit G [Roseitranquillus sediminis]
MKMELKGSEEIAASREALWEGLNDPAVLTKCIPGCKEMVETGPDAYEVKLQLKVAAVGGSFDGKVRLHDKEEPVHCRITISGGGSLGTGNGTAEFRIEETGPGTSRLDYEGTGEIGGLVAGVGQRVLGSVAKHLTKQFFTALRKHFAESGEAAA